VKLLAELIDLIYPPRCHICKAFLRENAAHLGREELSLCQACHRSLNAVTSPLCPVCGKPFAVRSGEDHTCEDCLLKRPFYDIARSPYVYEGNLMKAIHEFKYGKKSYLVRSLGPLLASYADTWLGRHNDLLVMPVPLHPKRLKERGFNQSLLLARHVASRLEASLDYLSLRRTRWTKPQIGLTSDERKKNVRRAFEIVHPEGLKGKTVLLVDDVATTGSTLNECARALKKARVKEVFCLALTCQTKNLPFQVNGTV
jgi:ComF family protein